MRYLKRFNESNNNLYQEIDFENWIDKGDIYVDMPINYSDRIKEYSNKKGWSFQLDEYNNIIVDNELSIVLDNDEYFHVTDSCHGVIYICDQLEGLLSLFDDIHILKQ